MSQPIRLSLLGKVFVFFFTLCSLTLSLSAQQPTWNLVWSDEFTGAAGTAPNSQYWTLEQGKPSDGGQNYNCLFTQTANGCDPNNPNVYQDGDGHLVIVARSAAAAPSGITSARIKTATSDNTTLLFGTQYGRVEASMQLPLDSGNQGVWPAFWMLGGDLNQAPWPASGEVDILEFIGKTNPTQVYSTLHFPQFSNTGLGVRATDSGGWTGWHTWGAIWSPNQVQFYVDDPTNIYGTISTADIPSSQTGVSSSTQSWPFNLPFYLILNLNMGGPFPGNVDATTTYPQTLLVDWVRVYHAAAPNPPTNVALSAASPSQANISWTASTSPNVTYNIYRSTVAGTTPMAQNDPIISDVPRKNQTLIANNLTATSYTDANLAPGQQYFYTVTSSGQYSGEGDAAPIGFTMSTGTAPIQGSLNISAAGYSGTGTYLLNSFVTGGSTNAFTAAVDTTGVTNPAPQDVYHTERWGAHTWVVGHLTPGGSYTLRMHFAESAFTGVGQRNFNVAVNGQVVLQNFDIYSLTGALNKVVTQSVNAVADSQGMIVLQLQVGTSSAPHLNPEIRALDVTPTTGGTLYGTSGGSSTYEAIDSGGPVVGSFVDDENVSGIPTNPDTVGGATNVTTQTINSSGVTNAAPAAVYQTERYGQFGYFFHDLLASKRYTVRLHFAEGVVANTSPGDRLFNISVNGAQVLTNFDIEASAGGINQAYVRDIQASSDEFGQIAVQLFVGAVNSPSFRGIEVIESSNPAPVLQIDAGGTATGTWLADTDYSGGSTSSTTAAIDTSHVSLPAPVSVYQSERRGSFTYTLPSLTPGATYTLNLHFAEIYWKAANKRLFDVSINGTAVLSNFDVFTAAGGADIAVVETFTATASSSGTITVKFAPGTADLPMVNGIEVVQ